MPALILIGSLVDAFLVVIYMFYGHPWIGILSKEKEPVEKQKQFKCQHCGFTHIKLDLVVQHKLNVHGIQSKMTTP